MAELRVMYFDAYEAILLAYAHSLFCEKHIVVLSVKRAAMGGIVAKQNTAL